MNNLFHVILMYIWVGNAFGVFFPLTELFCWVKQALSAAPEEKNVDLPSSCEQSSGIDQDFAIWFRIVDFLTGLAC